MRIYLSEWVVPVSFPPILEGAVAVEGGEIVAVGPAAAILKTYGERARAYAAVSSIRHPFDVAASSGVTDLGAGVLLPGFVNAHTHLELSWMREEGLPRGDFLAWVRGMTARRHLAAEEVEAAIDRGIAAILASGTVLVGDVGNRPAALEPLRRSGLKGRFFLELIGERTGGLGLSFEEAAAALEVEHGGAPPAEAGEALSCQAGRALPATTGGRLPGEAGGAPPGKACASPPEGNRPRPAGILPGNASSRDARHALEQDRAHPSSFSASLVPHAPHTVPRALLRRIADRARRRGEIVSVHAAESRAEVEFLRHGSGPFRALHERLGSLPEHWRPPGISPLEVLDAAELLGPRTLAVHCVHASDDDLRLIGRRGATVVLCPRSNRATGAGDPTLARFLLAGLKLALGTDSLASNDDLSLPRELAALRTLAPEVPADLLVRAATLGGAEALGFASHYGSLDPGKRAALVHMRRDAAGACPVPGGDRPGSPSRGDASVERPAIPAAEPLPRRSSSARIAPYRTPDDDQAHEVEPYGTLFSSRARVAVVSIP